MERPCGGHAVVADISNLDMKTPHGGNIVVADISTEIPPVAKSQLLTVLGGARKKCDMSENASWRQQVVADIST